MFKAGIIQVFNITLSNPISLAEQKNVPWHFYVDLCIKQGHKMLINTQFFYQSAVG